MKTQLLETEVKNLEFIHPEGEWTDDHYMNFAIQKIVNDKMILYALHLLLKDYPLMRIIYKNLLKKYIKDMQSNTTSSYKETVNFS